MEPQNTKTITMVIIIILIFIIGYVLFAKYNQNSFVDDSLMVVGVDSTILGVKNDDVGQYFVHAQSLQTLYTTNADCIGKCLEAWIPYEATDKVALGNIFTTEREDNSALQYTWKGERLYTYTLDIFGATSGDGVGGVWSIARP